MMVQKLRLPDGRNLDYVVSGAPDWFPFVFYHGTPGSCHQEPNVVAACQKKGLKLITLSRAGYGGSSRNRGRRVVDGVADVRALLEHLGVDRCLVGGWSGGGSHVLAAAARLPGCVAALCIAGEAPYDAEGLDFLAGQGEDNLEELNAALKGEDEIRQFCDGARSILTTGDVAKFLEESASALPEVDRQASLKYPELDRSNIATLAEGLRVSCDGWVDDDLGSVSPWGFDFSEIKVPVCLYHGSEDTMVPYAHGQWLAEHLPQDQVRKHLLHGEGHISIFLSHLDSMLDELLALEKK